MSEDIKGSKPAQFPKVAADETAFPSQELEAGMHCLRLASYHEAHNILQKVASQGDSPNSFFARLFLGGVYIEGLGVAKNKVVGKEHLRAFKQYITQKGYISDPKTYQDPFLMYCLGHLRYCGETFESSNTAAYYFDRAAQLGHAGALFRLGLCYTNDRHGVRKDEAKVMEYYTEAADKGSVAGMNALAVSLLNQGGDIVKTERWLKLAEMQGHQQSRTLWARMILSRGPEYYYDLRVHSSAKLEAAKMLLKARAQKFGYASYLLAEHCKKGTFNIFSPDEVEEIRKVHGLSLRDNSVLHLFALYKEAEDWGYPRACVALGWLRLDNSWRTFPKDAEDAFVYFHKALERERARVKGIDGLYECYSKGVGGVKKDPALAAEYLVELARAGTSRGLDGFKVVFDEDFDSSKHTNEWFRKKIYEDSLLPDTPYAIAINGFRRAIDLGYASANLELGRYYLKSAKASDAQLAVACFEKIADQEPQAMVELGKYYLDKDSIKAIAWFRRGAERGHAPAQQQLGFCYEKGKAVPANLKEAIYWYSMAASQGYVKAIDSFRRLLGFDFGHNKYDRYKQLVEKPRERVAETAVVLSDAKNSSPSIRSAAAPSTFFSSPVGGAVSRSDDQPVSDAKISALGASAESEQEEADILFERGMLHFKDSRDTVEALGFLIEATLQGHTGAQDALIHAINPEELIKWHEAALENRFEYIVTYYKSGAKRGDPALQYRWARCHELGLYGLAKNTDRAEYWYGKSAVQAHDHAGAAHEAFLRLAPGKMLLKLQAKPSSMFWDRETYPLAATHPLVTTDPIEAMDSVAATDPKADREMSVVVRLA